uniref:Brain protein I3 n=1 Tax=Panagrolaimus sp. JU765 TaxID=591449 RepID=A0AC34RQK1_9BILA
METIQLNGNYLPENELKKSSECEAELLPNQIVHFHAPPPIPPPPMILNQAPIYPAPPQIPMNVVINANQNDAPIYPAPPQIPMNVVINANQNDGGNINNGPGFYGGGFPCPFCRIGVMKRQRNPLIKVGVVLVALALFPIGLLACFLLLLPCAYQNKCTTCKKKV